MISGNAAVRVTVTSHRDERGYALTHAAERRSVQPPGRAAIRWRRCASWSATGPVRIIRAGGRHVQGDVRVRHGAATGCASGTSGPAGAATRARHVSAQASRVDRVVVEPRSQLHSVKGTGPPAHVVYRGIYASTPSMSEHFDHTSPTQVRTIRRLANGEGATPTISNGRRAVAPLCGTGDASDDALDLHDARLRPAIVQQNAAPDEAQRHDQPPDARRR